MMHISSIAELVEFFGGDTALAAELDISQSAVAHWKLRKQIAAGWHLRLLAMIIRRGASVAAEVFGLDEAELEALAGPMKKRAPRRPTRRLESRAI